MLKSLPSLPAAGPLLPGAIGAAAGAGAGGVGGCGAQGVLHARAHRPLCGRPLGGCSGASLAAPALCRSIERANAFAPGGASSGPGLALGEHRRAWPPATQSLPRTQRASCPRRPAATRAWPGTLLRPAARARGRWRRACWRTLRSACCRRWRPGTARLWSATVSRDGAGPGGPKSWRQKQHPCL